MGFEFDSAKSRANKRKHGIDFVEAQGLWGDSRALILDTTATVEPRFAVVGKIGEQHWTAIITFRNENIRLISVRRSRKREIASYEKD